MEATITITGGGPEGYTLKVALPESWLRNFGARAKLYVYGEQLRSTWGSGVEGKPVRSRVEQYGTLDEAHAVARRAREQIASAGEWLQAPENIVETLIISL